MTLTEQEKQLAKDLSKELFNSVIEGKELCVNINYVDFGIIFGELCPNFSCGHLVVKEINKEKEELTVYCNVFLVGGAGYKTHDKTISFIRLKMICYKEPDGWFSAAWFRFKNRKRLKAIKQAEITRGEITKIKGDGE